MKNYKPYLLTFLLSSLNALAIDSFSTDIERLTLSGREGTLSARELIVGSGTGKIGFKSSGDRMFGEIKIRPSGLTMQATNGMVVSSETSYGLSLLNEMLLEEAKVIYGPKETTLTTSYVMASNPKARGEATGVSLKCTTGADCSLQADKVLVDSKTLLKGINFSCLFANCSRHFTFSVQALDEGNAMRIRSLETRGLIEIKDLRTMTLKRVENIISLDGKVHILFGVTGFNLVAEIVTLNDDLLELKIKTLKLSDTLSVRDFSKYLIRKLLSSKNVSMNGDHVVIRFR